MPTHPIRPATDEDLLQVHVDALFRCDAAGRLRFNADPGYPDDDLDPAPRLWLGRTAQGALWRLRADLPSRVAQALDALAQQIPPVTDPTVMPPQAAAIRAALAVHAPLGAESHGPAFWIPAALPVSPLTVVITPTTAPLLALHFPWKQTPRALHAAGPLVATVVNGQAVAVCYCARLTVQAAEAGVDTTETARGHGYGQAAVAGWAAEIRAQGLLPLYSTTWDNAASLGIARRLGMVRYADTWTIQ